jgi:uncharacterized protein (DUF1499 family)
LFGGGFLLYDAEVDWRISMNTIKPTQMISYVVLAIALILAFILWNNHVFAGTRPTNIGTNNGNLAACPATPNCVSSSSPVSDLEHSIAPIQFGGKASATMENLKSVLKNTPRTTIVTEGSNNYFYAEVTSKLMGFVDDVEFYVDDSSKTVRVRSASRLGESDFGVNRQRIEEIRKQLQGLN